MYTAYRDVWLILNSPKRSPVVLIAASLWPELVYEGVTQSGQNLMNDGSVFVERDRPSCAIDLLNRGERAFY